jgi:hypothetical protein
MSDEIAPAIQALAAAASSPETVKIDRSTRMSDLSLMIALSALIAFAAALVGILAFCRWPDAQAHDQLHFLGWALWLAIGGILLCVAAIASPYVGRIQASAGPASLDLEGRK